MKTASLSNSRRKGFTLIEMSLVIFLLIAMMSAGFGISNALTRWKLGRAGSEMLRSVYSAQRTYLADHPTTPVASLTHAALLPYLPGGPAAFPTAISLENTQLHALVTVSPPRLTVTPGGVAGVRYDPSGSFTDSLWDVGE